MHTHTDTHTQYARTHTHNTHTQYACIHAHTHTQHTQTHYYQAVGCYYWLSAKTAVYTASCYVSIYTHTGHNTSAGYVQQQRFLPILESLHSLPATFMWHSHVPPFPRPRGSHGRAVWTGRLGNTFKSSILAGHSLSSGSSGKQTQRPYTNLP